MCLNQAQDDGFLVNVVSENGYLFSWMLSNYDPQSNKFENAELKRSNKIHNGSIEALSVRTRHDGIIRGVCCSSD